MHYYLMQTQPVHAELTIGVIGKTKNDSFYRQSFKGCEAFAQQVKQLTCIYDGANDFQDIRGQTIKVNEMIDKQVDALLISTTDSQFLVEGALKRAFKAGIPVITFDSDLMPEHHDYRLAYIGTNNFDFGVALGNYIKQKVGNKSKTVCIQSGHPTTPNLNERILGVRYALDGQKRHRLYSKDSWTEHPLCPLYSLGKRELALSQLLGVLKLPEPPIIIAVAGFAQFNLQYPELIGDYKSQIAKEEITIVSADTEQIQLASLKKGLSTANIGQNPYQMGHTGAKYLYEFLTAGKNPPSEFTYLDFHYCHKENADRCTINH